MAPEDVRAVREILQSAAKAADWSEASIRNSLLDTQSTSIVAAKGEEILGCIFGVHVEGEAEILNLAVTPSYRRQGIGRVLVRRMLGEWEPLGIRRVFLEVRESNAAAIGLYRSLGFRQFGRRKGYYSSPEEDALVLERT
jgi:[ribosomal protein S18]-alanine N-acetyltransferase